MNHRRLVSFAFVCLLALAATIPSAAWGAVELQELPSIKNPGEGLSVNLPLTDQASVVGVVSSARESHSAGGRVLYGELTGSASGTFMIWFGNQKVESFISLLSASPIDLASLPAGGYSATTEIGQITVVSETFLASDADFDCDLDDPVLTGVSAAGGASAATASSGALGGLVEDQAGATHPSDHIFYDLLNYAAGSLPVPVLNSYPFTGNQNHSNTPRAVIYLDFNGDHVTRQGTTYSRPAFVSPTGQNFVLTETEVAKIEDAFQVVAESLRPFNINVTTDLEVFLEAPKNARSWAFCTADYPGGVAPLSGFGGNENNPAIVGNRSATTGVQGGMIASHEVGHLLNVHHFGPGLPGNLGYYNGHLSYPGAPFGKWNTPTGESATGVFKIRQWTRGEYYGATYEGHGTFAGNPIVPPFYIDSLAKIDAELGAIGYRVDDRPNTQAAAKTLVSNAEFKGVIERNSDVDVFKISTSGPGAIVIDVLSLANHPAMEQIDGNTGKSIPALDVYAELRNSLGATIATSNPVNSLDALINVSNAAAGTYYLHVSGTGVGTPTSSSPTGYTSYGSIGSYSARATYVTNPLLKPDLRVTSFTYGASNSTDNGPWWWEMTPVATVKNFGNAPAPGAMVKTYLQFNTGSPEPLDVVFGYHDVLEPNAQATVNMYFPIDLTPLAAGDYRLGAKADAGNSVSESIESNNLLIGADVATITPLAPVTPVTPRIPPGAPGEGMTITSGQSLVLEAVTTDPQGDAITYHWDFDGDGVVDATSGPKASGQPSTITHTFHSSSGRTIYNVRVRAQADANGEPPTSPWCYLPSNSLVIAVDAP